ncbi:hypothetical protein MIND_00565000 [Mycena indigotica]|uniref:Uncharacterized protein n=1 Tax=Mycena indigotica TaxID=2126181 RepID=A0A8H6SRG4_9AGAR|nr:uncharacterized protein MIND_00565000 [Mycena indigotica]KAF7303371.1 hypothetical protein MIND_00565000 [Mycena indigotica]
MGRALSSSDIIDISNCRVPDMSPNPLSGLCWQWTQDDLRLDLLRSQHAERPPPRMNLKTLLLSGDARTLRAMAEWPLPRNALDNLHTLDARPGCLRARTGRGYLERSAHGCHGFGALASPPRPTKLLFQNFQGPRGGRTRVQRTTGRSWALPFVLCLDH